MPQSVWITGNATLNDLNSCELLSNLARNFAIDTKHYRLRETTRNSVDIAIFGSNFAIFIKYYNLTN